MRIVCFGEILLRYCPDISGNWERNHNMPVYVGGAELNVASALSKWGLEVVFCSTLPDNYLSKSIIDIIEKRDINTSKIIFSGSKIGSYYLPVGSELKHAGVIYDRAYSSFFNLKRGMIPWDEVLDGFDWLDISTICPALNQDVADVCEEALQAAKRKNIIVSIDLNYRKNLWQYGVAPQEVMKTLLPYCDVVMGNIWSIEALCGVKNIIETDQLEDKETLKNAGRSSVLALQKLYPNIFSVALTYRFNHEYWAMINHQNEFHISKLYQQLEMQDRVGSGDCFMAGIIYGVANNWHPKNIVDFAAAAAVGKLAEKGDNTQQSVDDILKRVHE